MADLVGWNDLAELMVRGLRKLECEQWPSYAQEWMDSLPSEFHKETDQACWVFCTNGEWPEPVDETVRLLIVLRCLFAIDRLSARFCRGEYHQIDKGARHIECYLIGDWYRDHAQWLAQRNPDGTWNFPFDPWDI